MNITLSHIMISMYKFKILIKVNFRQFVQSSLKILIIMSTDEINFNPICHGKINIYD